jgi:hypothetical protein
VRLIWLWMSMLPSVNESEVFVQHSSTGKGQT